MCSEATTITDDGVNELIINALQHRPVLWNMNLKTYKDNELKKVAWAEISFELKVDVAFIKTRWRSLRDRFMKEKKKATPKSGQAAVTKTGWHLMPSLHFLNSTVNSRETSTSMQIPPRTSPADPDNDNETELIVLGEADEMTLFESEQPQLMSPTCVVTENRDNTAPQVSFRNRTSKDDQSVQQNSNGVSTDNRPGSRPSTAQSSSRPTKRARNFSPDPVEKAVLEMVRDKNNGSFEKFTPDAHFYLAIAKDVQDFDLSMRLKIRKAVLDTVSRIIDEQNIN